MDPDEFDLRFVCRAGMFTGLFDAEIGICKFSVLSGDSDPDRTFGMEKIIGTFISFG